VFYQTGLTAQRPVWDIATGSFKLQGTPYNLLSLL
jgi:hypothetical protein